MSNPPDRGRKEASKEAAAGRQERLAAALRENLRRRKAQARGRGAGRPASREAERGAGTDTGKRDSEAPKS